MSRISRTAAFVLFTGSALVACASAARQATTADQDNSAGACALRPEDSTFALNGPVYRACALKTRAILLTKEIRPDFHVVAPGERGQRCYSAELEYVVDTKGRIEASTARIIKTNSQEYAQSVVQILPQLTFTPAQQDGAPVRQIVTDRRMMQTATVVVPAGSTRPSSSPPRMPRC